MTIGFRCNEEERGEAAEGRNVLGFLGAKIPKLGLNRLTLRRHESVPGKKGSICSSSATTRAPSMASSRSSCSRMQPQSWADAALDRMHRARAPPQSMKHPNSHAAALCQAAASARSQSAKCSVPGSATHSLAKTDLKAMPGSLMMTGKSFSATGSTDSASMASEVSPTCGFMGWASPPSPCPKRKKMCQQTGGGWGLARQSSWKGLQKNSTSAKGDLSEASVTSRVHGTVKFPASIAEESPALLGFAKLKMGRLGDVKKRSISADAPKEKTLGTRGGSSSSTSKLVSNTTRLTLKETLNGNERKVLKTVREDIGVSLRRFGKGFNYDVKPVCLGGLLSQEVFTHYNEKRDGKLRASELATMLRDYGMCIEFVAAARILKFIAGPEAEFLLFEDMAKLLLSVVEKRRGTGGEAGEILQAVYWSYDANKSGMLEVPEYTLFLNHCGHKPRSPDEWEDQNNLVASCRRDCLPGPIHFEEFVVLARKVHNRGHSAAMREQISRMGG